MHAGVGKEYVKFTEEKPLMGKVEVYLQDIIDTMRNSLRDIARGSLKAYGNTPKEQWLLMDPAQVTLLINVCSWVQNVEKAFLESASNKNAVKDAHTAQDAALRALILLV
jgi:dynein heavy chain